jgi:hypothetical protein
MESAPFNKDIFVPIGAEVAFERDGSGKVIALTDSQRGQLLQTSVIEGWRVPRCTIAAGTVQASTRSRSRVSVLPRSPTCALQTPG